VLGGLALVRGGDDAALGGHALGLLPERGELDVVYTLSPGVPRGEARLLLGVDERRRVERARVRVRFAELGLDHRERVARHVPPEPVEQERVVVEGARQLGRGLEERHAAIFTRFAARARKSVTPAAGGAARNAADPPSAPPPARERRERQAARHGVLGEPRVEPPLIESCRSPLRRLRENRRR
jgi:hypothetical protein